MSRRPLVSAGLLLLLLVVVVALVRPDDSAQDPLDPDNPRPDGAQAVARVLAEEGVEVRVARGSQELTEAAVDADTLVVVTNPGDLGRRTWAQARDAGAAGVVLVADAPTLEPLIPEIVPVAPATGRVAARCDDPAYDGLVIETEDAIAVDAGGAGCFRTGDGALLVEVDDDVRVLTAPQALANTQILEADNAAIALRLLGGTDRVVWYVADVTETAASDGRSLTLFLPAWALPSAWLAVIAMLVALLWRGRRLGPLVVEPLPVRVRATETTESRGRLYHRARDRGHAAGVLAAATRSRLTRPLGLGPDASAEVLASATADATGRPLADVQALLHPPTPAHDRDLTRLARDLLTLEDEVRHR
ncbi:DUF4350 domain-containing protein [Alteromonas gracilis]